MARKRTRPSPPSPPPPPPQSELERAIEGLSLPTATRHQALCLRLARLVLDLPLPGPRSSPGGPDRRVRHRPTLHTTSLLAWVVELLEANVLAGVVLTDALGYACELLSLFWPALECSFPDTEAKKYLTQATRDYHIEFQVSPGWELESRDEVHPAGYSGIALVQRCHLSRSFSGTTQRGRLVGQAGEQLERAAGFNLPGICYDGLRIGDDGRLIEPRLGQLGFDVTIPYAFVRRAFHRPGSANEPVTFIPCPSDQEVEELALAARERLVARGI